MKKLSRMEQDINDRIFLTLLSLAVGFFFGGLIIGLDAPYWVIFVGPILVLLVAYYYKFKGL